MILVKPVSYTHLTEHRKAYLQAGVNNTLPPHAEEDNIQRMNAYLRVRKESKLKEVSETHRKVLNTDVYKRQSSYIAS